MSDNNLSALPNQVITLEYGSGGQLTSSLLDQFIFSQFNNPLLSRKHDGAVFDASGKWAFTTDSFVVSPIFFPGGNIGELAVNGTVNDLAMCGANPMYLSLSFIIEEGLQMADFHKIIVSIGNACKQAGVQIITGDTKVVERGKGDKIFINTTGIGPLHKKAKIAVERISAEDVVVVSHNVGTHGVAILSVREGLSFDTSLVSDTTNLNHVVTGLLDKFGADIKFLRDATRGGVATVLVELAEQSHLGIALDESSLNTLSQVESACELLGLDPLFVANEGVFVAVVSAKQADDVLTFLKSHEKCSAAFRFGKMANGHHKKVILKTKLGGKRLLTKLIGEQLPRIC